jgi:hypothetical protein
MPARGVRGKEFLKHHAVGTVWVRGKIIDGMPTGYWEWFRKDGTILRSGHFVNGRQTGEWITYDRDVQKIKLTTTRLPERK